MHAPTYDAHDLAQAAACSPRWVRKVAERLRLAPEHKGNRLAWTQADAEAILDALQLARDTGPGRLCPDPGSASSSTGSENADIPTTGAVPGPVSGRPPDTTLLPAPAPARPAARPQPRPAPPVAANPSPLIELGRDFSVEDFPEVPGYRIVGRRRVRMQ